MLLVTLLRSSSAIRFAPLLILFVLFALSGDLTAFVTHQYWTGATGSASFALPFVAAACASGGAWEGSRVTRGRLDTWAPARSPMVIAVPLLLPVLAMGLVGMGVALVLTALASGPTWGFPHPGIVAAWMALLLGNTCCGFVIGRVLHVVIAVPLALLSSFVLGAYPSAMNPVWLRHPFGGGLSGCCQIDQVPDMRAIGSAVIFGIAIAGSSMLLIQRGGSRRQLGSAAAVLSVGLVGSCLLSMAVPADATIHRSNADLVCSGSKPRICLWPEIVERSDMIRASTISASRKLGNVGLQVPSTFTMSGKPLPGELALGIGDRPSPETVSAGVASGYLPEIPACAERSPFPGIEAYGPVAAWLYLSAGGSREEIDGRYGKEEAVIARQVMLQPNPVQLAWYKHNARALRSCSINPALDVKIFGANAEVKP